MRPTRRLAAALLLVSSLPFPAFAASDAADSAYWNYRIPAHHWHQWTAALSGNASHDDVSTSDDRQARHGQFLGQLRTTVTGGHDSDPLFESWALDVNLFGRRSHDEQVQSFAGQTDRADRAGSDLSERIIGAYAVRAYPWAFPWGFTAGTQHRFELAQGFDSQRDEFATSGNRQVLLSSNEAGRWIWNGDLSVGTGLGRVRDVTPVYEAQVLEDRLLASGALARPLSRFAREKLTALLTVQGDVSYAHSRPDKYFWEELERVLVEDGALERGSLTLFEAHRILEPPTIRGRIFRSAGWFVGPAVRLATAQTGFAAEARNTNLIYQADTLFSSTEFNLESDDYRRQDFVSTMLTAEFHHPAGANWQFDLRQDTSVQESGQFLFTSAAASAVWVVSDRWLATARLDHYVLWGGSGLERAPDTWNFQYGADLSYFLEDRWALTVSGVENQNHSDFGHGRSGSYSLGVSYVFSGLFEAPGLTAAMRPIPGGR
jgi:hypothetical protein